MEKVSVKTADDVELSALLWNSDAFSSVLLLHMMPAQKESWIDLADQLAASGFNVLAIDFRGHGESGGGNYRKFSPLQHQSYFNDVIAAVNYLRRLFPHSKIYVGGASIGANLAICYMARHRDIRKGFAISAGLDYYGVKAGDDVQKLDMSQKLLFIGSYDDVRGKELDCGRQAEKLFERAKSQKQKIIYDVGGHGTEIFIAHPELTQDIIKFLTT